MAASSCRHFNGYKPCIKGDTCSSACPAFDDIRQSILIVHLGALGAVVRSTSLLAAIRRRYPQSFITWVTQAPAEQLLLGHPWIDRVLTTSCADQLRLRGLQFDVALVIDKSIEAVALVKSTTVGQYFGFTTHEKTGAIIPANILAEELWSLGLSNENKFYKNKKTETQLVIEALGLGPFRRDQYFLPLTAHELESKKTRSFQWAKNPLQPIVGINTGCSQTIPNKKLTLDYQRRLISALVASGYENIVLLGGREDSERNELIGLDLPVSQSPTTLGLRDGLVSVAACDLVLTGDSLGMHLAISQNKYVVAWFGPTCQQEIDLYDRGIKILSSAECAPCWKSLCDKTRMCYDQVDLNHWLEAVREGHLIWQSESLLYKRHSSEIFFSESRSSSKFVPIGL